MFLLSIGMGSMALASCGSPVAASDAIPTGTPSADAPALDAIPLGDGKISNSPRVGYVYSCQSTFNGPAPVGSVPWISGTVWDLTAKPTVEGTVSWPDARISITRQGTTRVISANNLPLHTTGIFPIARSDPVYAYDANPNSILQQTILYQLPTTPVAAATPSCVPMGVIGFLTSGAALYNALDAAGKDAAAHEVQDRCAGHPQRVGQYHYHSYSTCFTDASGASGAHSDLIGYALDGYGIFGPIGSTGTDQLEADLIGSTSLWSFGTTGSENCSAPDGHRPICAATSAADAASA